MEEDRKAKKVNFSKYYQNVNMNSSNTKHKVFISYYHKTNNYYKEKFEKLFGHLFINKSVDEGDINDTNADDYIKRLIQKEFITDTSVIVLLIGEKTHCRKHIDWEISAALSKKVGGYSGLVGIRLPTHPSYGKKYDPATIPARFYDNVKSGYSRFYKWTDDDKLINKYVEEAFSARINKNDKIVNSRIQLKINKCS